MPKLRHDDPLTTELVVLAKRLPKIERAKLVGFAQALAAGLEHGSA